MRGRGAEEQQSYHYAVPKLHGYTIRVCVCVCERAISTSFAMAWFTRIATFDTLDSIQTVLPCIRDGVQKLAHVGTAC